MHRRVAGEFGRLFMPTRELDYKRHGIKLVLSSPTIALRLGAAEKEPFTVEWIERSVRAGDVLYDIGANVGAYSLIAAKVTGNRARVFAFEPSPPTFNDLVRNVLLNRCATSIVPLPLALWSETRLLSLTLRSLDPGAAKHRIHSLYSGGPVTETILAVRLDDLVERFRLSVPTHAKIDVDGPELEVLRGATRTLSRPEWRSIIIELDRDDTDRNDQVIRLLAEHGFVHGSPQRHVPSRRYPAPDQRAHVSWIFDRDAA
jgi:FkbM family methyltransferase